MIADSRQLTFDGKPYAVVLNDSDYALLIPLDEEADADGFIPCLWSKRDEQTGRLSEPQEPDGYDIHYHVQSGEIDLIERE